MRYKVKIYVTGSCTYHVEASTEEAAISAAMSQFEDGDDGVTELNESYPPAPSCTEVV